MTRTILILALVPFLGGCDFLDRMEGRKSPEQVEYERREQAGEPQIENPWVEPVKLVSEVPAPDPEPTCVPEFRVWDCVGNTRVPFEW